MVKITIFGLAGTGKSSVSKLFCERNDFVYKSSGSIFRDMAAKNSMDVSQFNKFCEDNPNIDMELDKKVREFGEENDDFVFEGRLCWHFIPDSVKIKLSSDFDVRINRISERDSESFEVKKKKTLEREKSEMKRYRDRYRIKDYAQDDNFDLVIDTTNLTSEQIVEKIEEFVMDF